MARVKRLPTRGAWLRRPGPEADAEREELARLLAPHELAALGSYYWEGWARDAQLPPREAWRTWLICAGRGFGKTRAGAEWVRDVARHDGNARIALVGSSLNEVRNVMVEGDSGVLAAAPGALAPVFEPSLRKLTWENGAIAWLYSAGEPESLRGPQHSHARRPVPEGGVGQRRARADRPAAPSRDRGRTGRTLRRPGGWPVLAGRHRGHRRIHRAGAVSRQLPGRKLGVRAAVRRHARVRPPDWAVRPLHRRVASRARTAPARWRSGRRRGGPCYNCHTFSVVAPDRNSSGRVVGTYPASGRSGGTRRVRSLDFLMFATKPMLNCNSLESKPACLNGWEKLQIGPLDGSKSSLKKGNNIMRKLVIGMALASTAIASPVLARDGAWYVELDGGPMIVEDIEFDLPAAPNAVIADTHTGYDFGGIVGYDFGWVRLEAEGSYRAADLNELQIGTAGVASRNGALARNQILGTDGDASVLSFMVNALADFGPDDGLQGFVGGGAGVARTKFDGATINLSGPGFLDDSDSGFAWQVLAGVRAPLTDSIDVGLKYRFFNTSTLDMVDSLGRDVNTKWRSHSLLGTVAFNFGGAPAPMQTCWDGTQLPMDATCPARPVPPPPPPPPVQAPVVQCNKGPYIVFFEWDKSDITPEASTILNNAASAYANCGAAAVMLAGHADRSGSSQYNVGLSQRRADAVRSYMTARGIPDTRISTEAFGETQPRVPTADGVRELQNRRVEITYGPGSGY